MKRLRQCWSILLSLFAFLGIDLEGGPPPGKRRRKRRPADPLRYYRRDRDRRRRPMTLALVRAWRKASIASQAIRSPIKPRVIPCLDSSRGTPMIASST